MTGRVQIEQQKTGDLVGVDGCRAGWVAAFRERESAAVKFKLFADFPAILERFGARDAIIAIDIPIGLPPPHPRTADVEARRKLGQRQGSRVFPAPARAALKGTTYEQCCRLNFEAVGKKISKQCFGILPKIGEVDRVMTEELQKVVYEVHPEIAFCIANGGPLEFSKKTREGQQERLGILREHGMIFDVEGARTEVGKGNVAIDDVLDAAAALWSAGRIASGEAEVLGDGQRDRKRLRMQIWA